VSNLKEDID